MKDDQDTNKIGSGHLAAMGRMGLQELRNAVWNESNISMQSEYGIYGTLTPSEISNGREAESPDQEAETPDIEEEKGSTLGDRLEQASERSDHGRSEREIERE